MPKADENSPLISENNDVLSTCRGTSSNSSVKNGNQITGCGGKFVVVTCILATELCERLTFFGLRANLLLFCSSELKLDPPWPSAISYLFSGWCINFSVSYVIK